MTAAAGTVRTSSVEGRLHLALATDPTPFAESVIATLVDGGRGYCIHRSLREYDDRTRRYLDAIQAIGQSLEPQDLTATTSCTGTSTRATFSSKEAP